MPEATPVTTPLAFTVAILVLVDDHVPPLAPSVRLVVEPAQTVAVPVIEPATGNGLTVIVAVT